MTLRLMTRSLRIKCVLSSVSLILGLSLNSQAFRVDTVRVHSASMDKYIPVVVVSPEKSLGPDGVGCPSVYLLHGHSADYKYWTSIRPDLGEVSDSLGFVFVCPDGENSWYFDSPVKKDSQYETFMTKELVPYVDSHYRTIPDKGYRAISGLSMGGHGALFLGMRHSDIWGSAGSMSGCPDIRKFPDSWNIKDDLGNFEANSELWNSLAVVNQIQNIKNGDLAIIIDCGESDFFLEVNKDMHARLLGAGIDHDFITRPGSHWFTYWQNSLDYHLLFHSKFFKKNTK